MKIVVPKVYHRGTCGTERKEPVSGRGAIRPGLDCDVCARPVGSPGAKAGVWKHLKPSRNGGVL